MRPALRHAAYTPAHARPIAPDVRDASDDRRRSWKPVLAIVCVYAVIIGVSEWRLQRHVDSVRSDSGGISQVDEVPAE